MGKEGAELWERQPWDTDTSYDRFVTFYLPQRNPRSVVEAYRRYKRNKGDTKGKILRAPSVWDNWSLGRTPKGKPIPNALSWKERAAAWDAEQHRVFLLGEQDRRQRMLERHAAYGRGLQSVGTKRLKQLEIDPDQLSDGEARRYITDGIKTEREAEGLPTWILQLQGLSDEELLAEYGATVEEAQGD